MEFPSDEDRNASSSTPLGRRNARKRRATYGSSVEKRRLAVVDDRLDDRLHSKSTSPTFDDAAWKASTTALEQKAKMRLSFGSRRKKSRYQSDDSDDNEILSDVDSKKSGSCRDEDEGPAAKLRYGDKDDTIRLSSPVRISTSVTDVASPHGFRSNVSPLVEESTPPDKIQGRRRGRRKQQDEADPVRPKKKQATEKSSESENSGNRKETEEASATTTTVDNDDDDDALLMEPVFGSSSKKSPPKSDGFQRTVAEASKQNRSSEVDNRGSRKKGHETETILHESYPNEDTKIADKTVKFSTEQNMDVETMDSNDRSNQHKSKDEEEASRNDGNETKNGQEDLLLTVRSELENMGKALRCPLCLRTLRNPSLLPCLHAFCRTCIVTSLDGGMTSAIGRKRRWTNNNGEGEETSFAGQCPCCKVKCSKRGLVPSQNLTDQVSAYKQLVHAFGMAPVVHDETIEMTQMEDLARLDDFRDDEIETQERDVVPQDDWDGVGHPEAMDGKKEGKDSKLGSLVTGTILANVKSPMTKDNAKEPANSPQQIAVSDKKRKAAELSRDEQEHKKRSRKSKPTIQECHEHLEVSRTMHTALKSMAESTAKRFEEQSSGNDRPPEGEGEVCSAEADAEMKNTEKAISGPKNKDNRRGKQKTAGDAVAEENTRSRRHLPRTAKDFERMNEMRRIEMLVKEQERVLRTDEKALIRSAVSTQRKNARRSLPARASLASNETSVFILKGRIDGEKPSNETFPSPPNEETEGGDKVVTDESYEVETQILGEDTAEKVDSVLVEPNSVGDGDTGEGRETSLEVKSNESRARTGKKAPKSHSREDFVGGGSDRVDNINSPVVKTSGRGSHVDETSREHLDQRGTPAHSDRHPESVGERSSVNSENSLDVLERSMNEARENEAADRSGEFALDAEGVCFRVEGREVMEETDGLELDERQKVEELRETGNQPVAAATTDDEATSNQGGLDQRGANDHPSNPSRSSSLTNTTLSVGNIVSVQSRTWPGVNKPGGVGKILRVYTDSESGTRYDVAYILGGKEKNVDSSFVQLEQEVQDAITPTSSSRESVGSDAREQSEQNARRKSRRSADKENDPPWLKDIIASVAAETMLELKVSRKERDAGTKKGKTTVEKRRRSPPPTKAKAKVEPTDKKRAAERKGTSKKKKPVGRRLAVKTEPSEKKRRKVSKGNGPNADSSSGTKDSLDDAKDEHDADNATLWKEFKGLRSLSAREKSRLADERIKHVLSGGQTKEKSKRPVIHLIPSGVSEHDKGLLRIMCDKIRKKSGVSCKVAKDFQSQNNTVCITPHRHCVGGRSSDDSDASVGNFSKLRTVKVMRAALMGIPILTPQWVEACVQQSEVVAATGNMCIRSLPTKADELMDRSDAGACAVYGLDLYSAFFQRQMVNGAEASPFPLLSNISVLLCGAWEKGESGPIKGDVQSLLVESQANMLTSIGTTAAKFRDLSARGSSEDVEVEEKVVLLCDESVRDATCGISESLAREFRAAVTGGDEGPSAGRFLVVNAYWLFDCISCGAILNGDFYEPSSPRAKELWRLCVGRKEE